MNVVIMMQAQPSPEQFRAVALASALETAGVETGWAHEIARVIATFLQLDADLSPEEATRLVLEQRIANPGAGRDKRFHSLLPRASDIARLARIVSETWKGSVS